MSLADLGDQQPKALWYAGEWRAEVFAKCAAVVGSRQMTEYGRRVVDKLIPRLVDEGYTIVSGFMYGVDQAAHAACVACAGRTVAILGWGIAQPLEGQEAALAKQIVAGGGLMVSEWENQLGALWTFPIRNRIVAALAASVYVVEAAVKSGSMITVDWARKLGRQIWAVPGPVTSRVSAGTNQLISDGTAKIWVPDTSRSNQSKDRDRYTDNAEIYIALQNEALSVDELVRKTGRSAEEVGAQLSVGVLRGEVEEKAGKYYIVS